MSEVVISAGDTAWVLASSALVLLMTPGLALFYGGMVRSKSVLNMMMMSLISIGIVSVLWVIYGFKLAFGYEANSQWFGEISLSGLGSAVDELTNNGGVYPIPLLAFAAFQLMFAIITPALISGAIADRTKFTAWAVFVISLVYLGLFPSCTLGLCLWIAERAILEDGLPTNSKQSTLLAGLQFISMLVSPHSRLHSYSESGPALAVRHSDHITSPWS